MRESHSVATQPPQDPLTLPWGFSRRPQVRPRLYMHRCEREIVSSSLAGRLAFAVISERAFSELDIFQFAGWPTGVDDDREGRQGRMSPARSFSSIADWSRMCRQTEL